MTAEDSKDTSQGSMNVNGRDWCQYIRIYTYTALQLYKICMQSRGIIGTKTIKKMNYFLKSLMLQVFI